MRFVLLVHTVTVRDAGCEVNHKYFHALRSERQLGRIRPRAHAKFLGKAVSMTICGKVDARKAVQPRVTRHHFRAFRIVNAPAARGSRSTANLPALPISADVSTKMEEGAGEALSPIPPMPPRPTVEPIPAVQQPEQFTVDMGREQVSSWLVRNGFEMLTTTFCHFSGPDMLRLNRQDLISMCGLPNGLRLFYAIRSKPAIRLTMYVNLPGKSYYVAIYLSTARRAELMLKLAALLQMSDSPTIELLMAGPNGIHVLVTDELLSNVPNEAAFSLNVHQDDASGRRRLLLKSTAA